MERYATAYACLGDGFPEFVFAFIQCCFATQPTLQQDCSRLPVEFLNWRAVTIRRDLAGPEDQPDCRNECKGCVLVPVSGHRSMIGYLPRSVPSAVGLPHSGNQRLSTRQECNAARTGAWDPPLACSLASAPGKHHVVCKEDVGKEGAHGNQPIGVIDHF